MVIFRRVEGRQRDDFRHNRFGPDTFLLDLSNDLVRDPALLVVVVEYDRSILWPDVCTLAIGRSGVVGRKEYFDQITVGNHLGIERDLHDFGVAGGTRTDLMIRRIGDVTPCIAGHGTFNALQLLEYGLHAPEASPAECGS